MYGVGGDGGNPDMQNLLEEMMDDGYLIDHFVKDDGAVK